MSGEINTLLSDYALAAVTALLAWRLRGVREGQAARALWAIAFAALATGALTGGTYHGFRETLPRPVLSIVWKATVFAIGIGAAAMIAGSAGATAAGMVRRFLRWLAAASLVAYAAWMLFHDAYIYVVSYTAVAMALIAVLHAWSAARGDHASRWMLAGVGVSALAAGAQASGFDPYRYFNHNDLYHAIQIAGMLLFYLGAKRLRDRDQRAH